MVTAAAVDGRGSIGLIAVAACARGQGVGSELVRAAHGWMRGRSARESRVVTQLENVAARRLYEHCGYQLHDVQLVYHFRPAPR
jgi:ribosomal protein S18 acetylase RimI-like enzyme